MEGQELGHLDVPGIDLEPLDPFLDDVFAGLDDHPPGLWHPTLVEAPAIQHQQQSSPWDDTPAQQDGQQSLATHALDPSTQLLSPGHQWGKGLPDASGLPSSQQLHVQHKAQHDPEEVQQEGLVFDQIQDSSYDNTGLSSQLHIRIHALNAPHMDMQSSSSSSSTLSPVSSAAEMAANSSNSSSNKGLPLRDESAAITARGLDASDTSNHMNPVGVQASTNTEVLAAAPAMADAPVVASDSCSSPSSGNIVSEGSVPDIDDVPAEQLSSDPAGCGEQQQQQDDVRHTTATQDEPNHGSSTEVHVQSHEDCQLTDAQGLPEGAGSGATQQDDNPPLSQQQDCEALTAASTAAPEVLQDEAGHQTSPGDPVDFVSPSSSWHTCMTHGSHMTSHSVMSAASFAAAAAEQRALKLHLGPEHLQQQQSGTAVVCSDHKLVCSKVLTAVEQVLLQPAAAPLTEADAADSMDIGVAPAAAEGAQQADEWSRPSNDLVGQRASHEHQEEQSDSEHEQASIAAAQGHQQTASGRWQQEQQQQQQDELWQDVSPPSLGSSPPTPSGYTSVHAMHTQELPATATTSEDAAAGVPTQHTGDAQNAPLPAIPSLEPHRHHQLFGVMNSVANSSYVLRQSELVDLSLSSSVHPSQQQQFRAGWLNAHQYLPPAAALAVERAACALNDSYFFHERLGAQQGHSQHQQQHKGSLGLHPPTFSSNAGASHATGASGSSSNGPSGGALSSSGLLNTGLLRNRSSAGQQWSRASTQPQQDQQARHSLPSPGAPAVSGVWSRPGVLGQWFTHTLQQPLAAAASRAAAGVGHRLVAAGLAAGGSGGHLGDRRGPAAAITGTTISVNHVVGSAAAGDEGGDARSSEEIAQDAVLVEHTPDMPQSLQEQEDTAFQGLLFLGGRDSHSRPVVIVNTDAIPAGHNAAPRDAALAYLLRKLTPIVAKGPYVLVMVSFNAGSQFRLLPGVWCVRAYHLLPRAFRKNVKHVLLLQPSWLVRAGLALLYPFVSSKAHGKIKKVHHLLDIESATSGEVQVPHLGEAFLTAVQHVSNTQQQTAAGHQPGPGSSRTVPVPGAVVH